MRHDDPNIQRAFEDFVGNVCQEIKKSKHDFSRLESAMQTKSSVYDENVKRLYEEMEAQIKAEKAMILEQVLFVLLGLIFSLNNTVRFEGRNERKTIKRKIGN